jgi:mRNA-degrading endonuclease RelE of RelBE toxin-antitoxin system
VKLAGADDPWDIRVPQYRVIYQISDDELLLSVVKIADRKDHGHPADIQHR